jgi:hypothetical protein
MHTTRLIKQEMNDRFIRLYFYQLVQDGFVFSDSIKKEFIALYGEITPKLLEELSYKQLKKMLGQHYVDEVFLFSSDLLIRWLNQFSLCDLLSENRKIEIPVIHTHIMQTSMDYPGLIILESYNVQLYDLYTLNGEPLLGECSDLELGPYGRIRYRANNSIFFEEVKLKLQIIDEPLTQKEERKFFPNIEERDTVELDSTEISTLFSAIQSEEDVIRSLNEHPESYKILQPLYKNTPELALVAIRMNSLSFSLLSDNLTGNKQFVLSVLNICENQEFIYNCLSNRLKTDSDIVALCDFVNASDIENLDVEDDDLPF